MHLHRRVHNRKFEHQTLNFYAPIYGGNVFIDIKENTKSSVTYSQAPPHVLSNKMCHDESMSTVTPVLWHAFCQQPGVPYLVPGGQSPLLPPWWLCWRVGFLWRSWWAHWAAAPCPSLRAPWRLPVQSEGRRSAGQLGQERRRRNQEAGYSSLIIIISYLAHKIFVQVAASSNIEHPIYCCTN